MHLRIRNDSPADAPHAYLRVSAGPDADHLAYAGHLSLRADEWAALEGVLTVGSEGSPHTVEITTNQKD